MKKGTLLFSHGLKETLEVTFLFPASNVMFCRRTAGRDLFDNLVDITTSDCLLLDS